MESKKKAARLMNEAAWQCNHSFNFTLNTLNGSMHQMSKAEVSHG
jgi:hypothetical protein